jgi:hypothetical protein
MRPSAKGALFSTSVHYSISVGGLVDQLRGPCHDGSFVPRHGKGVMTQAENDDIEPDATAPSTDGRTRLMQEVAEQMDTIEADLGRDFEIGRVITIVEVTGPDGNVGLRIRAGQLPWVSLGMLDFAKKSIEAQMAG